MPEPTPRTLNHFAFFSFDTTYYSLAVEARAEFSQRWLEDVRCASHQAHVYQVYPAQAGVDLLVWSALPAEEPQSAAQFHTAFARATNPHRGLLQPVQILWGVTRPSQYTRTRSNQEIDVFASRHASYLVIYPFVKTAEWYRLSREARQGMMNEHIRIGKEYPQISQLLLYSFGMQDQEFIVVYETEDLVQFSDLVYELRGSEARRFTERDTPIYTALYHPAEETLALWK